MKLKNDSWQREMYDDAFADATLGSKEYEKLARLEVAFLRKAMGLAPGETLLDAPCGTGRHARAFAKAGLKVTGLDINPALIRRAKRDHSPKKKTAYVVGDLLLLDQYRGRFDAVVNLFTSFGYFSTEVKNLAVMRGLVRALKPGGRIAFNLIDRDWLLKNFQASSCSETKGVWVLETRHYDPKTRVIEAHTLLLDRKKGQGKSYYHRTRLYSKTEMVKLMKSCGLTRVEVYGDSDGSSFKKYETSHPTFIGWKGKK